MGIHIAADCAADQNPGNSTADRGHSASIALADLVADRTACNAANRAADQIAVAANEIA